MIACSTPPYYSKARKKHLMIHDNGITYYTTGVQHGSEKDITNFSHATTALHHMFCG
jgi:hypothetical protein